MEPEGQPSLPDAPQPEVTLQPSFAAEPVAVERQPWETQILHGIFVGPQGLRAGWSALIFYSFYRVFSLVLGTLAVSIDPGLTKLDFSPGLVLFSDLVPLIAIVAAASIVALFEGRKILEYNLTGADRTFHFFTGLGLGFASLSVLVGALHWAGWLNFGPAGLSGAGIVKAGALWAVAFLTVSLVEEGSFRCFLQFTFTRGLNFWWALAGVSAACAWLQFTSTGNGIRGVFLVAAVGVFPCLWLELRETPGSGFWQAAWVTSTLFGFVHTSNGGENWIGIFAASLIGFVFCVSVWATGSAWWAIGCHAAWDWAETYFYGAADSGNVAVGHYLTTNPSGPALWSGGTDGPEGSLLVIPVVLLLLLVILVLYGRGRHAATTDSASETAVV